MTAETQYIEVEDELDELVEQLVYGAQDGDEHDVKAAIKAGVDVNAVDYGGSTAMHKAAANGHIHIVNLLLQHDASVSVRNEMGNTPLHWACLTGRPEIVKLLLDAGANGSALNKYERTPVDEAISGNHMDLVDIINAHPRTLAAVAAFESSAALDNDEDAACSDMQQDETLALSERPAPGAALRSKQEQAVQSTVQSCAACLSGKARVVCEEGLQHRMAGAMDSSAAAGTTCTGRDAESAMDVQVVEAADSTGDQLPRKFGSPRDLGWQDPLQEICDALLSAHDSSRSLCEPECCIEP